MRDEMKKWTFRARGFLVMTPASVRAEERRSEEASERERRRREAERESEQDKS
jgi:hypothetical protein